MAIAVTGLRTGSMPATRRPQPDPGHNKNRMAREAGRPADRRHPDDRQRRAPPVPALLRAAASDAPAAGIVATAISRAWQHKTAAGGVGASAVSPAHTGTSRLGGGEDTTVLLMTARAIRRSERRARSDRTAHFERRCGRSVRVSISANTQSFMPMAEAKLRWRRAGLRIVDGAPPTVWIACLSEYGSVVEGCIE